jgi:hypothetical protein
MKPVLGPGLPIECTDLTGEPAGHGIGSGTERYVRLGSLGTMERTADGGRAKDTLGGRRVHPASAPGRPSSSLAARIGVSALRIEALQVGLAACSFLD